jgi:MoaA/NifB/PqqE/SkfB family radical SAM enzyme
MSNKDKALNSETFCLLPFIHMATKTDGDMKLCCRSWPIDNISNASVEDTWNGEDYRRIRKQMLNSEKPPECDACWRHEAIGVRSMRQRYNKTRTERYLPKLDSLTDDYKMPFQIPVMEAKLSNFCNLKCRMCHPLDSTSWSKDWSEIEHLMKEANESTYTKVKEYNLTEKPYISGWDQNENFWEEFEQLAPYFDRIEFAGGEPLIDPIHYKILHLLEPYAENIELKYSSNLTRLDYKKDNVLELWKNFKKVEVNVSIDGIYEIYDYVRQLGNYEQVKENIRKVAEHEKTVVIAAVTLSAYNIQSLPEMIDEFVENLNIFVHTHRVNYPTFLDVRIIPETLKTQIVKKLEDYRDSLDKKKNVNWYTNKKNVINHLNDAINSLKGGDLTKHIPNFIEFSDRLDQKQKVKKTWRELLPDLANSIDIHTGDN